MRIVNKDRKLDTKYSQILLRQQYQQIVVPKSLQDKIMWIMHNQMGHPGKTRTVETTKIRYFWVECTQTYISIARIADSATSGKPTTCRRRYLSCDMIMVRDQTREFTWT